MTGKIDPDRVGAALEGATQTWPCRRDEEYSDALWS